MLPDVHHVLQPSNDQSLEADPRWHFHQGLDHQFLNLFADESLDFVYIDSAHNF